MSQQGNSFPTRQPAPIGISSGDEKSSEEESNKGETDDDTDHQETVFGEEWEYEGVIDDKGAKPKDFEEKYSSSCFSPSI